MIRKRLSDASQLRKLRRLLRKLRLDERDSANTLSLTANETVLSGLCRSFLSSTLGDRYFLGMISERLPSRFMLKGGLMLRGLPRLCALEQAAHDAAKDLFGAAASDFRPLSGVHATLCTLSLITQPNDVVYSVPPQYGGHFATRSILNRLGRRSRFLPWDPDTFTWDSAAMSRSFAVAPPSAILLDLGATLRPLPVRSLRETVGSRVPILYDASHTFGLIAGGVFPNPLLQGSDILQGNTHKTFPGPQKGMIHFHSRRLARTVSSSLSQGFVSSQHTHESIALYVAMLEMQFFAKSYARQMVANAAVLSTELESRGFGLIRSGADTPHSNVLLIARIRNGDAYLACERLFRGGISTNAQPFAGRAVLRLGTQEITRRGMTEPQMKSIADLFERLLIRREKERTVRGDVIELLRSHRNVHYSFDESLGLWQ